MKLRYFDADTVSKKWLIILLRGLITVCFAIILLVHPKLEVKILVILFGSFILIDGVVAICTGFIDQKLDFILFGFMSIMIGIYAFFTHKEAAFFFLALFAAWSLLRGIFEVSAATKLDQKLIHRWQLLFSGVLSNIFCILSILLQPSNVLPKIWVFITYFLVIGLVWIFYAFNLRAIDRKFLRKRTLKISKLII